MKIIRDGKTYKLTEEELLNAFLEEQHNSDMDLIKNNLEYYDADDEGLEHNKTFLHEAATRYRKIIDDFYNDFSVALDEAMDIVLPKYRWQY